MKPMPFLGSRAAFLSLCLVGCSLGGVDSIGDSNSAAETGGASSQTGELSEPECVCSASGGASSSSSGGNAGTDSTSGGTAAISTEPVSVPGSEYTIVGSQLAFINNPALDELSVRTSQLTVDVGTVLHTMTWALDGDAAMTYNGCETGISLVLSGCAEGSTTECLTVHLLERGILWGQYVDPDGITYPLAGTLRGVFGPVDGSLTPADNPSVLYAALDLLSIGGTTSIAITGQIVASLPVYMTLC